MFSITIDGFEEALRQIVREELESHAGHWLNSQQAAAYLGTSIAQVHNLVSAGRLPRHGEKGSGLRFRRSDLDAYLETRGRRA